MAGAWASLENEPDFAASTSFLLTDGRVMVQEEGTNRWWALAPDAAGDYVTGTWRLLALSVHARRFYASAVLADGRVVVAGGEYGDAGGSDIDSAEIYDPFADEWTTIGTPGWGWLGDASSCLLADGRFLVGSIVDPRCAVYDPTTNQWSAAASKSVSCDEETWTLLPDNTVLAVNTMAPPAAERYLPDQDRWVSSGNTPVELVQSSSAEIGPAILLNDTRTLCMGATGHTALYVHPAAIADLGAWLVGPDIPNDNQGRRQKAKDSPATLLPSGNVLLVAGPASDDGSDWPSTTNFFEFDATTDTITAIANPPANHTVAYVARLLLLPTGQVMYTNGSGTVSIYTPAGGPLDAWRPRVTACPTALAPGWSGHLLNGMSQAVSYGDDAAQATNYPLVRLTDPVSGRVVYCPTSGHTSMAINRPRETVSTNFTVPAGTPAGQYQLTVIANGIASEPTTVSVGGPGASLWARYDLVRELLEEPGDPPYAAGRRAFVAVTPRHRVLHERTLRAYDRARDAFHDLDEIADQVAHERTQLTVATADAPRVKPVTGRRA